ncbi:MAG: SH3 domain-containing protein, partial [Fischerella sp.]
MQFQRLASAFFISGCALATVSWFAAIAGEVAVVTAKSLNVRTGPGNEYRSTYVLRQGDRVEIIERKGE